MHKASTSAPRWRSSTPDLTSDWGVPQADTLWTEVESRDGLPAQASRWPSAMSTVHPLSVITAVVSQCRTDLNGAASGAVAELVERLARQRLTELHAHPEQLIHGGGASPTVRLLRTGHEGSCHGEPRQRGHR